MLLRITNTLKRIIQRTVSKVGLKKRVYAHLFRHSRVTHLLNKNELNEIQAKKYFGWSPDSNMLANYSHLTSRDVNKVMLQIAGIKENDKKDEKNNVRICQSCRKPNDPTMKYCGFCGKPLIMDTILELDKIKERVAELSIGFAKSGGSMEDYFRGLIKNEMNKRR